MPVHKVGKFGLLRHKLLAWFLLISLLPLLGMSLIGFSITHSALQHSAFEKLEALRSARAGQLETYWAEQRRNMAALSDTVMALGLDALSIPKSPPPANQARRTFSPGSQNSTATTICC